MYILFYICIIGVIGILPLYALSLEHTKLDNKYGTEKGKKIGSIYGLISGWGFFIFWFGTWLAPQPKFTVPFLQVPTLFSIPLLNLIIALPPIILAFWFGLVGVKETGLETAETHRAKEIIDDGIYSIVRHPQYLGGLFGHIGFSILFSALYSLIFFPFMIFIVYLISKKEEIELIKEFGDDYEKYKNNVPMLFPRIKKNR